MIKQFIEKILLMTLLFGSSFTSQGQFSETFYLDANQNITSPDNFEIRYHVKQLGNDIKIKEYYSNDTLKADYYYLFTKKIELSSDNFFNLIRSNIIVLHGYYNKYDINGELIEQSVYNKGELKFGPYIPKENDSLYIIVEDIPRFESDEYENFRDYISKNLKYPEEAKQKNIQGKVHVRFIVDKNGDVCKVKVTKKVHKILNKEAVRVISNSPKWIPGYQKGEAVDVMFTVPIIFEETD